MHRIKRGNILVSIRTIGVNIIVFLLLLGFAGCNSSEDNRSGNLDTSSKNTATINYDGLYWASGNDSEQFLKFYDDGTAIGVSCSKGVSPGDITKWFNRSHHAVSTGEFHISNGVISFALRSSAGVVDYEGVMGDTILSLDIFSHINNYRGTSDFRYVPLSTIRNHALGEVSDEIQDSSRTPSGAEAEPQESVPATNTSQVDYNAQQLENYVNNEYALSFKYPKSWLLMTPAEIRKKTKGRLDTKDVIVFVIHPSDPDRNVNIKVYDIEKDHLTKSELSDLQVMMDRQYPNMFESFRKLSSQLVRISDVNALEYVMDTGRSGTTMRHKSLMITKSRRNYVVTFTAQQEHFDEADNECFQVIQSSITIAERR